MDPKVLIPGLAGPPFAGLGMLFGVDPLTVLAYCGIGLLAITGMVLVQAFRLSALPAASAFGRALKRKINTFWEEPPTPIP